MLDELLARLVTVSVLEEVIHIKSMVRFWHIFGIFLVGVIGYFAGWVRGAKHGHHFRHELISEEQWQKMYPIGGNK